MSGTAPPPGYDEARSEQLTALDHADRVITQPRVASLAWTVKTSKGQKVGVPKAVRPP
ncbi:hypothetical protein GCM10017567_75960 [Amycolatopsis bullii]|uniref:Uncharacterized protein n=1 Tax=Amycolatopsis bullii TaxID=941987 RepID=A0ABQ3KPX9_9PSEU|nr:hypothetical protein GCM10017567_75960 [Amycolatopsis bullii]